MKYKLFHYPCYNSSPEIKIFDLWNELEDYITEEVERRVQFQVDHSPFSISEKEREEIEEEEWTLVKIEEI
tara:strand:+ start:281 stop:493 length:213 start_codon:yes stop_codon:yes gene_type:complete